MLADMAVNQTVSINRMIHLARYFALLLEIYQQIVQVDFYPTIPLFHPHQPQKSTYTRKKVKLKMISGYRFEPTFFEPNFYEEHQKNVLTK